MPIAAAASRAAWWQSGYAADCKSAYAGSIPAQASNRRSCMGAAALPKDRALVIRSSSAVEQAAVNRRVGGSNPSSRAIPKKGYPMTRVIIALCALVALGISDAARGQDAIPKLTGTWTGTFTGGVRFGGGDLSPADPKPIFVSEALKRQYTLKIDEQQGRGVLGTWSSTSGSQPIQGVIRLDNRTVQLVDTDSYLTATILSANELEFCNQTTNDKDRFAFCFLLKRQ